MEKNPHLFKLLLHTDCLFGTDFYIEDNKGEQKQITLGHIVTTNKMIDLIDDLLESLSKTDDARKGGSQCRPFEIQNSLYFG